MHYLDRAHNKNIIIPDHTLIRPINLEHHIGETLLFHNGNGYIVSGVLTNAKYNDDEFSFLGRCSGIDYHTELDMAMCYFPNRIHSICDSVQYGYEIVVNHIITDELMHNIKYITVPTEKENAFRKMMLSKSPEWYERNIGKLDEMMSRYEKESIYLDTTYDWDLLSEEDQKTVDAIFKEN